MNGEGSDTNESRIQEDQGRKTDEGTEIPEEAIKEKPTRRERSRMVGPGRASIPFAVASRKTTRNTLTVKLEAALPHKYP